MAQTHTNNALHFLADRPLSPVIHLALRLVVVLAKWEERRRTRKHLKDLDDHILNDIGLTRHIAEKEAARPFWMP